MKAWQHGIEMERLTPIARLFQRAEAGRVIGRFLKVDEAWVAARLAEHRLFVSGSTAVAVKEHKARGRWIAHNGVTVAMPEPGQVVVERFVGDPAEALQALGRYDGRVVGLQSPLPHPEAHELAEALGLDWVGSKVPAGGEVVGMWAEEATGRPLTPIEEASAIELPLDIDIAPLLAELPNVELPWAQHYSGYNKRHSWTALSLRGYGPIDHIEKPAEMSKKWKQEHPGWEHIACEDTPLREALPAVEPILDQLGARNPDRVRLMRLAPGHGELTRHADITDHEAGFGPGMLARIHVPLVTNPAVVFQAWALRDGYGRQFHMRLGRATALDHTKPHAAVNDGEQARIHLVIDAPVEGQTERLLAEGKRLCP